MSQLCEVPRDLLLIAHEALGTQVETLDAFNVPGCSGLTLEAGLYLRRARDAHRELKAYLYADGYRNPAQLPLRA